MLEDVVIKLRRMWFKADLYMRVEGRDVNTGITVEYKPPDVMIIKGLKPELPPMVRLSGGYRDAAISWDGEAWSYPGRLEEAEELGIYCILDPRVVLKMLERVKGSGGGFEGVLNIARLAEAGLIPERVLEWFKMYEESERRVAVTLNREGFPETMAQKDIPPHEHMVILRFRYEGS